MRKVIIITLLLFLCLCFSPIKAYAIDLHSEVNKAFSRLDELNIQIDNLYFEYEEALTTYIYSQDRIQAFKEAIGEQYTKINDLQNKLNQRTVASYYDEQVNVLDIILNSDSLNVLVSNSDSLIQETKDLCQLILQEKNEYEEQECFSKEEIDQLFIMAEEEYNNLNAEIMAFIAETSERQVQIEKTKQGQPVDFPITGNPVVDRAYGELGKPYIWGACGPQGFDCSGLVSYCITGEYNYRIGTTFTFRSLEKIDEPQLGDICLNHNHCGIYIGNGQMIHAPMRYDIVRISPVQDNMIYVRY